MNESKGQSLRGDVWDEFHRGTVSSDSGVNDGPAPLDGGPSVEFKWAHRSGDLRYRSQITAPIVVSHCVPIDFFYIPCCRSMLANCSPSMGLFVCSIKQ